MSVSISQHAWNGGCDGRGTIAEAGRGEGIEVLREVGRFMVATAAGAGMGAGAAIARRRRLRARDEAGEVTNLPASGEPAIAPSPNVHVERPGQPPLPPTRAAVSTAVSPADLEALQASVADLEAARARLRQRAAALRAEMEGQSER